MDKFTRLKSVAAPLMQANMDTDMIIPMDRYLMADRDDMHQYAFEVLRYLSDGSDNPEFILNNPLFRGAKILITGPNFGCGSSRESAVWALHGLGIRCIIAPSFGNIFYNNCFQNGLLPIVLDAEMVAQLANKADGGNVGPLEIDLEHQQIVSPDGEAHGFNIDPQRQRQLLQGLDDIGVTLTQTETITKFRGRDEKSRPWIYL